MHRTYLHTQTLKFLEDKQREPFFRFTLPLLFPIAEFGRARSLIWKKQRKKYPPEKTYKGMIDGNLNLI